MRSEYKWIAYDQNEGLLGLGLKKHWPKIVPTLRHFRAIRHRQHKRLSMATLCSCCTAIIPSDTDPITPIRVPRPYR